MKTFIFLLLSIASAFVFDIVWGQIAGGIIPPIAVLAILYWFWRLDLGQRIVLAIISGAILDTIGFLPSGTYMLILMGLAFICEPMKTFFSNTESRMVIALNVIILAAILRILVLPASSFILLFI